MTTNPRHRAQVRAARAALGSLALPGRESKPRRLGLTVVIDNGAPTAQFQDAISSAAPYIDRVKFGWGTAVVTPQLEQKLAVLDDLDIGWFFGGTLFEKFVLQGRFRDYLRLCRNFGCRHVEVSDGTVIIPSLEKARYISRLAEEFMVMSEVGYKDPLRSATLSGQQWIDFIRQDLQAGASFVITEARESGRGGICDENGVLRQEVVEEIVQSGIDSERLIFEAPTKALQTFFITRIGPDVNLGNIALNDVIALETLRLGLRADTLMHFEREALREDDKIGA